jgi:hypothetical protein
VIKLLHKFIIFLHFQQSLWLLLVMIHISDSWWLFPLMSLVRVNETLYSSMIQFSLKVIIISTSCRQCIAEDISFLCYMSYSNYSQNSLLIYSFIISQYSYRSGFYHLILQLWCSSFLSLLLLVLVCRVQNAVND